MRFCGTHQPKRNKISKLYPTRSMAFTRNIEIGRIRFDIQETYIDKLPDGFNLNSFKFFVSSFF
jgi:hypothetical protein